MPTEEDLKAIVVHKNVRRGEEKKRRKRKRTPSYSSQSSASRSPSSGSDREDKKKELIKSLPPIPGGGDIGFIPSRFLKRDSTRQRSSEKSRDSRRAPERGDALVSYPGYSSQSSAHPGKPSEDDRSHKKREGDRRDSERSRREDERRDEGRPRGADERREEPRDDERRDDRRGDEKRDERRDEDKRGDRRDDRRDDDRKDERRDEDRRGGDERSDYRRDKRIEEERRGEDRRDDRRDDRERKRSIRKESVEREEDSKYKSSQSSAPRSDPRPTDRGDRGDRASYRDSPQSSFRRSMRDTDRANTKYHDKEGRDKEGREKEGREKEGRDKDGKEDKKRDSSHSKRDEDDEEYDAISDEELAMLEDESGLADIFRELEREMRAKRYKAVLDHIDFTALEPLAKESTAKDPATLLSKCGYSSAYGGKALTERVKELFIQRGQEAPLKGAYSANPVTVESILKDTLSPTLALSAHTDARLRQRLDALNNNKNIVDVESSLEKHNKKGSQVPEILPMERIPVNNSLLQDSVRLFNSLAGTNLEVK